MMVMTDIVLEAPVNYTDVAFVCGFLVGLIFTAFFIWYVLWSKKDMLRRYYISLDDGQKKQLDDNIDALVETYKDLAVKTNTRFFTSCYNDLMDLKNRIHKRL